MRAAGFEPLVPYPGTKKPWKSRHLACGQALAPTLDTVRSRGTACRACSAKAAGRRSWTAESAIQAFLAAGLEPLEPWPVKSGGVVYDGDPSVGLIRPSVRGL